MTVSGNTIYETIKGKVLELERLHEGLSKNIYDCGSQISKLVQDREETFVKLATIYLPEMDAKSIRDTLKELQAEVQRIYETKRARRRELENLIDRSKVNRTHFNKKLESVTSKLEEKVAERDTIQEAIAGELKANPVYVELDTRAKQAKERFIRNQNGYEEFQDEALNKLKAYESNKLFMYLVKRNFSTDRYTATGLVRELDRLVAKVVNFSKNKANYDFLKKMPDAIKEEVKKQESELEGIVRRIDSIEEKTEHKHGLPKVLDEGTKLGKERESIIALIANEDKEFSQYVAGIKELDNTKDEYHQEALSRLKGYLKGNTIAELKARAKSTPKPEDDQLVDKIESIDENVRKLKDKAKDYKSTQEKLADQLDGLKKIEKMYNDNDFESSRSYFDDGFNFNDILTGYLLGRMSHGDVFKRIKERQKFKPRPAPSYSYSSPSSSWGSSSSSRSSWGGGGSGSRSSFGGGGFGSRGGFSIKVGGFGSRGGF